MLSNLISSDELMERLFSPLNKPPPLNSTLAGYFGRVVGCLLVKRALDIHKWLAAHPAVLPALVRHVDTTSTVEVILRLVGAPLCCRLPAPEPFLRSAPACSLGFFVRWFGAASSVTMPCPGGIMQPRSPACFQVCFEFRGCGGFAFFISIHRF